MKYLYKMMIGNLLSLIKIGIYLLGSYFIVYQIQDTGVQLIGIIAFITTMAFTGIDFMPFNEPKEIKSLKELREWYDENAKGYEWFEVSAKELENLELEALRHD